MYLRRSLPEQASQSHTGLTNFVLIAVSQSLPLYLATRCLFNDDKMPCPLLHVLLEAPEEYTRSLYSIVSEWLVTPFSVITV